MTEFTHLVYVCSFIVFIRGQSNNVDDRGILFNRRPLLQGSSGVSPCGMGGGDVYDAIDPDQRSLQFIGGAVVGGAVGGLAGYHLGMKNPKPVVINNNVINQLPSPCYSIPVHVTTGGDGGGGGPWGGGGLVGGILSNHPILSNILQGGLLGGGGGRAPDRTISRNIRQFQRQVVRPISRIFK